MLNVYKGKFMKDFNLEFDEDYCVEVSVSGEKNKILLYLSDSLSVIDDLPDLPESYKDSIIFLISNSNEWYSKAIKKISNELVDEKNIKLMCIYILTEPDEQPLIFGAQFRVPSDEEHGRGMKFRSDSMEIIEYGLADVAFC